VRGWYVQPLVGSLDARVDVSLPAIGCNVARSCRMFDVEKTGLRSLRCRRCCSPGDTSCHTVVRRDSVRSDAPIVAMSPSPNTILFELGSAGSMQ
jgi:hypothetical protein